MVTGSLKFDSLELSSTALQARARDRVLRYFRVPASRPVIVAGSTMKGEEIAVLRAFRKARTAAPNTLLVLAPRNPERFAEAEQLARQEGWKVARRSDLAIDAEPRVERRRPRPRRIKLKRGETVVFSWIVFRSRAHRDRVNALVMKDKRLGASMDSKSMPFDFKRMVYGGFKVVVDL